MNVDLEDVKVKGISDISDEDINFSKRFGYTMKLIGIAQRDGESGGQRTANFTS